MSGLLTRLTRRWTSPHIAVYHFDNFHYCSDARLSCRPTLSPELQPNQGDAALSTSLREQQQQNKYVSKESVAGCYCIIHCMCISHRTREYNAAFLDESLWWSVNTPTQGGRCSRGCCGCKMQVADKRRNNNKWPLIITDAEDNMVNVGERLRGKGAPRWFIFLSNRKKKKENTSLHVRLHPRHSQVTPDQPACTLKFQEYFSSCKKPICIFLTAS